MNIISSLLKWIGDTIGANPSTLATTSKTLVGAINEVKAKNDTITQLTTTYTQNNYVTETAFNRIHAYVKNDVVYIMGNLNISTQIPQSTEITIGRINLPKTLIESVSVIVPSGDGGTGNVGITPAGHISIYRYAAMTAKWTSWVRFCIAVPLSD